MSSVFDHLDEAVERIIAARAALLGDPYAVNRAARLAVAFEFEACAWSQLYELSSLRLIWRAALAAEAGARANAGLWTQRVAQERAGATPVESWATGRVNGPRPVALTTNRAGSGR